MKTKGSRELFAITIIAILLLLYAAYSRKSSEAATIVNPIAENPEWIELTKQFAKAEFKNSTGSFRYRFFSPKIDEGKTYPLVIYLHGEEERGDDNEKQIATQRGGTVFARPQWQEKHPCFIFAPQCPVAADWQDERMVQLIAAALDELPQKYPIDFSRVYITGISMGGSGTWNLINKHPRFFAAAMPICGAYTVDSFKSAKKVPVWAFHAADDPIVPVGSPLVVKDTPQVESVFGTRKLMAALRSAGNLDTRYTEYAAGVMQEKYGVEPHNVWEAAYQDEAAIEWLFSHDLHNMIEINYIMPGVWNIDDTSYDSSFYIVEGKDKALVIDTGVSDIDLFQTAKSLTHLPFELAITHAHGDHLKLDNIKKFDKFYMSLKDKDLFENLKKTKYPESKFTANSIIDVKQGDRIDLGGSIVIEAVNLGDGHSPGSFGFLDRYHRVIFTGDAIGSGRHVGLRSPSTPTNNAYLENLKNFSALLSREGLEDILFLGGHRKQEYGFANAGVVLPYNPLTKATVDDLVVLLSRVQNKEAEFAEAVDHNRPVWSVTYGAAQILFRSKE